MKKEIYYFSGTGNSLFVAKELKEKLGAQELFPISKFLDQKELIIGADEVGVVFPCYCMTAPKVVKEFLQKIKFEKKDVYLYIIVTHNNQPGQSGVDANKILKNKLSYYDTVLMPGNSVIMKDWTNPIEEVNKRLDNCGKAIDKIAENIKNRKIEFREIKESKFALFTGRINDVFINKFYKIHKRFWTNDKCNDCGLCKKVCPMNNIEIENKKVNWKNNCEACLACYHWCPQKAVELSNYTKDKVRRTNPNIKVNEIIID